MLRARLDSSANNYPVCGFTFDGHACRQRGDHICLKRADKVRAFFSELLVHTKGIYARRPFILSEWQWQEIVLPMFGQAVFDPEIESYRRQYRLAWWELARKNGKSELLAGCGLYLTMGDDEESAEVYGAAEDIPQGRKVWDVAYRMIQLSPVLAAMWRRGEIKVNMQDKRIIYEPTYSYYQVITAEEKGELGHNPHGVLLDEVIAQRGPGFWNAMRTARGTRMQPMMIAATTAGDDVSSFAGQEHDYCMRVAENPEMDPSRFVFLRNTPPDADPWDEKTWEFANPALGDFLLRSALREDAQEARNDPLKENAFRQYRLNQWVNPVSRYLSVTLWDRCGGLIVEKDLEGKRCYGGLDLSATTDLTALCWLFPDFVPMVLIWHFWLPAARMRFFKSYGKPVDVWAREGFITITEGDIIDYENVESHIMRDAERFAVEDIGIDRWNSTGTVTRLANEGLICALIGQGFAGMSAPMKELKRLLMARALNHGGNPVARWHAESLEAKQDPAENVKPVKPERAKSEARIDGMVSAIMAVDGWMRRGQEGASVYEEHGLEYA